MSNKETLLNLIQNTQLSKKELSRKLDRFLYNNYDSMLVKIMRDQLMQLNIPEEINEEKIIELINVFDENAITHPIEQVKVEDEKRIEENNTIQEAYNTMVIENETLRKSLKQKDETLKDLKDKNEQLKNTNDQIINRLSKLETFFERFKKYNITEVNELIELEDENINSLYVSYLKEGNKQLDNGYIFETGDSLIIPKSYYRVEKEND